MECWLRIALIQLAHLPKGATTRPRVPYYSPQQNGLATLLALLLIAVRDPLLTTSSPLPGLLLTRLSLRFHHLLVLSKSACYSRLSNATSCASPFGALLKTSSHLPSPLLLVISSNLPFLSPRCPVIKFYLISRITSTHLTSNSMLCDNTLLCPRTLFSSPMGS